MFNSLHRAPGDTEEDGRHVPTQQRAGFTGSPRSLRVGVKVNL